MLRLPQVIRVYLQDLEGQRLRLPGILIGLNTLVHSNYYYGTIIGLTNEQGEASISGPEISRQFLHDQGSFPMDYKVDLEDCDPAVDIILLSESEIEEAKKAIEETYNVRPETAELYRAARNSIVRPSAIRAIFDDAPGEVQIPIPTALSVPSD